MFTPSLVFSLLIYDNCANCYLAITLNCPVGVDSLCAYSKLLEDFFFTQFPKGFSPKLYSWYHSFFWLYFGGFSFHCFSADTIWEQTSLYARGIAAIGYLTFFFCPSTPNSVSSIHYSVFAASKQFTFCRAMFYSSQNLHNPFSLKLDIFS